MRITPAIVVAEVTPAAAECQAASPLSRLDRLGILISSVCLVHCLALPLAIALLPTVAEALPSDFWVHMLLIGVAVPLTGFTLLRGYLAHRNPRPMLLGAAGLLIVAWGLLAAAPITGAALTVFGGLLVAGAHLLNMRDYRAYCSDPGHAHG